MPNTSNVSSPFTIVGNGRSGTSLLSKAFNAHPDCFFAGETVNLIHSVWKSLESSLPEKKAAEIPDVIRHQFLRLFPSTQKYWMHKPIGVPIVARFFSNEEEFFGWFWDVIEQVFPDAKYFTVLRHPLDVLSSSHQWWGRSYESIIESNRRIARIVTHPKSKVHFGVNYHDLVAQPREQLRALFDYLDFPFHENCLKAFDVGHVVSKGPSGSAPPETPETAEQFKTRKERGFSHKEAWRDLNPKLLTADYRQAVEASWSKFGHDFGGWAI